MLLLPLVLAAAACPQDPPAPEAPADPPRGLVLRADGATPGYTFIAPLKRQEIFLVDLDGTAVHSWQVDLPSGSDCYLTDQGHLLHCFREEDNAIFRAGGLGGHIRELDWNGDVLWHYRLADQHHTAHHDIEPLPNGNLLVITYENWSKDQAIARGRDASVLDDKGLWPDAIFEIEPTRPEGGRVVWEWHVADHLVQDADPAKPDYGGVPESVGRLDLNGDHRAEVAMTAEQREAHAAVLREMAALGYAGDDDDEEPAEDAEAAERKKRHSGPDWMHTNGIDYEPELDLIVISSPEMCELYVIDHSTTTEEAAGSTGGRYGHGGDFLWRWGNPRNYGLGQSSDQRLFYQHNPTFLRGPGGDLRVLVFNNGGGRADGDYSSVDELVLPFDPARGFLREPGAPYGPSEPAWSYSDRGTFFSSFISGAQRLPNGNTVICEGAKGRVFEVTRAGEIVWEYLNPYEPTAEPTKTGGNAPPFALFRAQRIPADHPGLRGRL